MDADRRLVRGVAHVVQHATLYGLDVAGVPLPVGDLAPVVPARFGEGATDDDEGSRGITVGRQVRVFAFS